MAVPKTQDQGIRVCLVKEDRKVEVIFMVSMCHFGVKKMNSEKISTLHSYN